MVGWGGGGVWRGVMHWLCCGHTLTAFPQAEHEPCPSPTLPPTLPPSLPPPAGRVQTLMSVDADRVVNLCLSFHELWSLPLQILVALWLLYTQARSWALWLLCAQTRGRAGAHPEAGG